MIKKGLHIALLFYGISLLAQSRNDSVAVHFHLEYNKLPLELGKKYISANNDTLTIEAFKCYISNIRVQYDDNSAFTEKNSYHLLDSAHPDSFHIPVTVKTDRLISKITFDIGIDSITNTSGAMAGDLDPIKGMYWAWQSGYINTKIEGRSPGCKARNNEFLFHIGGYLQPYYALRSRTFGPDNKTASIINIGIDLHLFVSNLELQKTNSVMIPGKEAMALADLAAKMFYVQ
jgi:hypothetical protein